MYIDRILEVATYALWIILGIAVLWSFIGSARRHGIRSAFIRLISYRYVFPVFLAILVSLLSSSLVFVEPQEVAVVVSVVSPRGFREQPLRSGLHWIAPFVETPIYYPIYWQTYTMSGKPFEGQTVGNDAIVARTSDGQEVTIDSSVIFRLNADDTVRVHIDWQNRYIDDLIRPIVRGIIRFEVSQFTVDEVNSSKRADLEQNIDGRLSLVFEDKGFVLDQFVLRNIGFSPEYSASVELKQVAEQETSRREHEANQIRVLAAGNADRIRIEVQAEAEAIVIKAQAEAEALALIAEALKRSPDLLSYRYISQLSPNISVMLLPNDAPFLIPLPTPPAVERIPTIEENSETILESMFPAPTPTTTPTATPTPAGP